MHRILLVEDEENFGSLLQNYLKISGYHVDWYQDGSKGYSAAMQETYDLFIFDVMMPNMDGFTLAEKLVEKGISTPLFFLTAKNMKSDLIKGYQLGADDYLTKPFDTDVLLLKIKAIIARFKAVVEQRTKELYELNNLKFRPGKRLLIGLEEEIKLSPKESALLDLLCQYENRIMPREVALNTIWKEDNYFTKRSMDVYINKLRKILVIDDSINIETFHQMGFQLNVKKD